MRKKEILWYIFFTGSFLGLLVLILKLKSLGGINTDMLTEEEVSALKESVRMCVLLGGLLIGLMLGAVLQRSMLCLVIACHDVITFRDLTQMRAFAIAVFVAILGTQVLYRIGEVNIEYSIYLSTPFTPVSYMVGGLLFGFGIVLAGGCAGRILVSAAEGNLSGLLSLMAFVFSSGATLWGVTAWIRTDLLDRFVLRISSQYIPELMKMFPWWMSIFLIGGPLLLFVLRAPRTSNWWSWKWLFTGISVGLIIVLAWWINGISHRLMPQLDPFTYTGVDDQTLLQYWRPKSLTFALANAQTFRYLFIWTAEQMNFAIASVFGVLMGAFLSSLITKTFRVVAPDLRQFKDSLIGGSLMGFGAVVAKGCNIGQGMSGFSTLSAGSLVTVLFIILGAFAGSYYMNWRISREVKF